MQPDADRDRKGEFVRRTVLALTAMFAALILSSGVALAAAVSGTQGNDTLRGTARGDQIYGLNGNDTLRGFRGSDELYAGAGNDNLNAGPGNDELYGGSGIDNLFGGLGSDFVNSADRGTSDLVDCGNPDGISDRVIRDNEDRVRNCDAQDNVTIAM